MWDICFSISRPLAQVNHKKNTEQHNFKDSWVVTKGSLVFQMRISKRNSVEKYGFQMVFFVLCDFLGFGITLKGRKSFLAQKVNDGKNERNVSISLI